MSDQEWLALKREIDDPAYIARVKKATAGRTSVELVKEFRGEMEAADRRRSDRRKRAG
jgi:hypothetical protein